MTIINIREFKRNIREFQDEKLRNGRLRKKHENEAKFYLRTLSAHLNGVNKKLNFGE